MNKYITTQGDTWDMIAFTVYGNELYADVLMQNNLRLLDYFIFPAGIEVELPEIVASEEELPPWRTSNGS